MAKLFNRHKDKHKRIFLRRNQTTAEEILWEYLRNKKMRGIKFKRQFGVGIYVLDFYAPAINLAIELDGTNHQRSDVKKYDHDRELAINELGISFIRFTNEEVETEITEVLNMISQKIGNLI